MRFMENWKERDVCRSRSMTKIKTEISKNSMGAEISFFFLFSNQMPHSESWVFFANTTLKSAELHNRSQAIIRQVYVHCWHARIQTKNFKIKEYAAGRRRRLTTTTANEEEEKFLFQLKRKWLCGMNDGNRNSHGK